MSAWWTGLPRESQAISDEVVSDPKEREEREDYNDNGNNNDRGNKDNYTKHE